MVRHAHSTYTPDELNRPLSEEGRKEANKLVNIFKNKEIDEVLASPYKRAIETVEGIAKEYQKEVKIIEDFRERLLSSEPISDGDFDGAVRKVWELETFVHIGGESNIDAQNRGVSALEKILKMYSGKKVAIGTHGNIMALIMKHYDLKYDYEFWKKLSMPDIYCLVFEDKKFLSAERVWK